MLTLFTTCKPFEGLAGIHQYNALASWTKIVPLPEIIMLGNEPGAAEVADELGLSRFYPIERDSNGLPLVGPMFEQAQNVAQNDVVGYCNADIVFVDGLIQTTRRARKEFPNGFLLTGRRWDVSMDAPIDFESDWRGQLRAKIEVKGDLYSPCGFDWFVFRRPLEWDIPDFVVGMPRWDNWMLWQAVQERTPIVTATFTATAAHPRHGYGPEGDLKQQEWQGSTRSEGNLRLAHGKVYCLRDVERAGLLWRVTPGGIVKV